MYFFQALAINPSFEDAGEDEESLACLSLQSTEEVVTGPAATQHTLIYLDYKSAERVSFKMFYSFLLFRMRQACNKLIHTAAQYIENIQRQ